MGMGRMEECETHASKFLELDMKYSESTSVPSLLINDLLGVCLLQQERFEEARQRFQFVVLNARSLLDSSSSPSSSSSSSFDMFSDSPQPLPQASTSASAAAANKRALGRGGTEGGLNLNENWDDAEGYYQCQIGEVLSGRYRVVSVFGRGVFSSVVRAVDLSTPPTASGKPVEVAIKMIRSNDMMKRAAEKEKNILNKIAQADPQNKKHCVRLLGAFDYRGHSCLVFEPLAMNLRETLKKFSKDKKTGKFVGLSIEAVRAYGKQVFSALKLLRKIGIMHADLKPDNILIGENNALCKLADFGSASPVEENDITAYLVSRFYRAPEIILGAPYDASIDVWSLGCTLYELYTGKILFHGRTNNEMLKLMMEVKGRFSNKLLRRGQFSSMHFDGNGDFVFVDTDPVSRKEFTRKIQFSNPTKDLGSLLNSVSSGRKELVDEIKQRNLLRDLLEKCLALDPLKRIDPAAALQHPFFKPAGASSASAK
eukprot:GILI01017522.1.p1 GENE.GILI01017522.1~~GILI01017522.1.p1  ORF type:complete len:538 (-),score=135.14 GILI01017522.1:205-1656(-)